MCSIVSLAVHFSFPIGLCGTKLKLKTSQSTWYKQHLDQLVQINASIVWRWTGDHEVRHSEISLGPLTSSDSICRPTLSLNPMSIMFGAISINSHWLESSCKVSRHWKHFKKISLIFILTGPAWCYLCCFPSSCSDILLHEGKTLHWYIFPTLGHSYLEIQSRLPAHEWCKHQQEDSQSFNCCTLT